ncbi:hypothetical protein [Brucella tritici]|uniref:Uncharacterized protein n=1 Tax=Brucella tritici TaxID=94626 RepID=A0A6L3YUU0_9HYPH|nr:hypothetical protein [Brucella tritici]KAB2688454.1 hypothetical protein F9L08_06080 [Brucella tritici]
MSDEIAFWTWRSLSEGRSLTEVTEEHLSRIRTLTVVWNEAESGAAVLADADFTEIENLGNDADEESFLNALEVFMTTATVAGFEGMIQNPYARAGKDDRCALENTPSREIADQLLSGQDIDYRAEPDEITLWQNANRRACGIDPKRPYGSESVSRDVRALIDPDKKLSNAAFAKRRKWLESRMLLVLQFFVQNATLAPGLWRRGDDWVWRPVQPDDPPPPGEPLTRAEWMSRMDRQTYYENREYTETIHALAHLTWNNRLSGSYSDLVRQFSLANHFDSRIRAEYEGTLDERFRAALAAFPERRGDGSIPWFTLSYVRILNAQARFDEARAVLEAADLFEIDNDEVNLSTVNPIGLAWAEGLIARHGAGVMSEDEYQAALFGEHPQWYVEPTLWSFVWDLHYNPDRFKDTAQEPGMAHARALASQLELSRSR